MIPFVYRWRTKGGAPIVRDDYVAGYAEAILADYDPKRLKEPGKIDALDFLERYLGVNLEFQDIYFSEDSKAIAGATVFREGTVKVFDQENMDTKQIYVKPGTIIIDNKTMQEGREGFALFTQLHEAAHFCMHQGCFQAVMCRSNGIGIRRKLVTDQDFMEHQADVFAAAIAMPQQVFIETAQQIMEEQHIGEETDGILVLKEIQRYTPIYPRRVLTRQLSEKFGVSRTAAEVQLWKHGLIMMLDDYEKQISA